MRYALPNFAPSLAVIGLVLVHSRVAGYHVLAFCLSHQYFRCKPGAPGVLGQARDSGDGEGVVSQ